jgi:hypothetical protein
MIRFATAAALAVSLLASSPALASGGSRYGCPETRWCGCWLAKKLHLKSRDLYRAFAWLGIGHRISGPKVGAIVVYSHSHVGQITAIKKNGIVVLSGNDGSAVRNRLRSTAGVIGYRAL